MDPPKRLEPVAADLLPNKEEDCAVDVLGFDPNSEGVEGAEEEDVGAGA